MPLQNERFAAAPFLPNPKGSLAKGSWHGVAVTEGFTEGAFPKYKPMWKGEGFLVNSEEGIGKKFRRLCLRNPPGLASPNHPPFGKGGFGALPRFPPGNVTGHWRGGNDLLKITVRIATGGTPAAGTAR